MINADGTITYTPNANFNGTDTITYTISDGQGGTSTATVMVTVVPVNDPPVAASDVAATSEDVPVTIPVLANDSDLDGDNLTVTAATAPNGTVVINADGTITYTPNPDFNGTDTITYTVSDGKGGTATATVTVTVAPVNDAPRLMPDTAVVAEDSVVTINVLANDVDVEGDPLTVTAASAPNGTVVINPDGTITYTPNANFNGTDTITYTVSDGMGGVSTTTVTVTVTPVNDPPVAANDSGTINEDTTVRLPVLANDTDLDGDQLTVTSASAPNGTVVINADGTISYTPNANFNGTDTITYSISDGKGGTSTAIATITILPVNDPPIVGPDTATVPEEGSVTINVLANDSDPEGDPLTLTAASAANGTVVINPDGTITYTPRKDFFGVDTITYTVSDGKGGFTTATAAVTVTVSNIQDPPTDGNETISIVDGQTVNIAVLANAVDVDNDPLSVTAATVTIGTLVINPDGTITYTAPFGYEGVATITYTVSDGKGGTVVSTVTINVERQGIDVEQMLRRDDLDARVPDFARIDAGRISDEQFISTPLIVVDTVNSFRSLNGTTDLSVSAPILEAVNGISSLKGVGSFDVDGNPILAEVANLDRIVDFRFGVDRLFDHRFGDFGVKGLTGFSVRQLDTGSDQLMIESVIRDRVIYMETRDIGKQGDSPVKEFQLRMRSGAPLPDWIRFDSRGLAIIERPADADEIRLIVRAIREDGKVIEVPVIIQGATGEIQLDQKLAPKPGHISRAMTLDQAAKLAENAANDGAAKLSAAFSG